jgi:hypothetical protein
MEEKRVPCRQESFRHDGSFWMAPRRPKEGHEEQQLLLLSNPVLAE